jgi:peptidoglycan/LPS O-acetylase OafA/YrhL
VSQISSDRFNVALFPPSPRLRRTGAQKVARPHPGLLPQEKGQKKSVVRPSATNSQFLYGVPVVALIYYRNALRFDSDCLFAFGDGFRLPKLGCCGGIHSRDGWPPSQPGSWAVNRPERKGNLPMYTPSKRIEYLDSIRGLAALFVLLSHTVGAFAWPETYAQVWTLPFISIFFNGPEAVAMFFLLSGFVLARPYISDDPPSRSVRTIFLPTFYLRRFIRIWIPWFFVFLLSILARKLFFTQPSTVPPITTWLSQYWHEPLTVGDFLKQCVFQLHDPRKLLLNQDWSLGVELKGSILVPLFIFLSVRKRLPFLWLIAAFLLLLVGTGHYYIVFIMGVLIARFEKRLLALFVDRALGFGLVIFLAGITLYQGLAFFPQPMGGNQWVNKLGWVTTGTGCGMILIAALGSPVIQRVLLHRTIVWLGRISYSLYLLQFIIILCLLPQIVTGLNHLGVFESAILFPVSVLTSVVATVTCSLAMHKYVEAPVIVFGHAITKRIQARFEK